LENGALGRKAQQEASIAALYQAGMGQRDWGEALGVLADYVDAGGITLDTYDFGASRGTVLASNMAPDPAILEYNAVYGHANPLAERTQRQLRDGCVYRASDFVPISEFMQTELYNTVYRKLGLKHLSAISIEYKQSRSTQLSVIKPVDAADFDDREVTQLAAVQAHVRQAWAGYCELSRTRRRLDELTSLWNLVEFAVVVVDSRRTIQFANRTAEDLLRALTRSGPDDVGAALLRHPELARALNGVLADGGVRHVGALGLSPAPRLRATLFGMAPGTAAILMTDPLRHRDLPLRALRRRFELTDAEARVVRRIVAGDTIRQAAERLGIGYETARSQIKSAMARNGWRRQSQMLADVFSELLPFGLESQRHR
jgi:DNA-binding CsgD family transcriptional regulator